MARILDEKCPQCGAPSGTISYYDKAGVHRMAASIRCSDCIELAHWQTCRGCNRRFRHTGTERATYCSPPCRQIHSKKEKYLETAESLYGTGKDYEESWIIAVTKDVITKTPDGDGRLHNQVRRTHGK